MDNSDTPPSTSGSPTSVGFSIDRLPHNTSSLTDSYSGDDEAAVDPPVFVDDDGGDGDGNKEEEEGEDLFDDNYMEDYRRMDDQDRYETVGMDDSMEDERDLDQIMADRRAAEVELDARDGRTGDILDRKLPQMLYDQDMDEDINFRPPKRFRADFGPPTGGRSEDDTEGSTQSSPGRFQRGHSGDDVPVADQMDDDQYEDEYDGEDDIMCHVQGTLREWVTRDEVRRFIAKKFKDFLLTYVNPKNEHGDIEYVRLINEMRFYALMHIQFGAHQADSSEQNDSYRRCCYSAIWSFSSVKYDCNKCGAILGPFLQNSYSEVKVGACPECQSKGLFTINVEKTIYRNYQKLTLQESPGVVPAGRIPRYKEVILLNDLIDCARPGEEIEVTGIYTNNSDLSLNTKNGFPVFATVVEANSVTEKQDLFSACKFTDEDKAEIEKLAKDPRIGERIVKSIAPSIYGHEDIKMAIALAMFGGQEKIVQGKHRLRGDINVLLLGDPGTAKSQFLKYVEKTGHRAVYTTGKGASAVGLTAAVHKDPVTREWTLEGGALVLADRGVCLIDEFDKMSDQDRVSIHEAMEQQSISIAKAGIVTSLQARCSVIAAANPIGGRYDSSKTFTQNVELTDPIISRFDILCVVKDIVDPVTDEMLARFVVDSHARSHPASNSRDELASSRPVDPERGQGIRIAVRHIESMIRMSEAHARMHLRNYVSQEDEDMAIRVLLDSFISSQKFGVQNALQKSFRKYMTFKKDFNGLLLHLLCVLVKDALQFEEIVSGTTAHLTHIEVKVEELRNKKKEKEKARSDPMDNSDNPPSTPGSPTSAGFSTDRLPHNTSRTTDSYSDDDEAAVDPHVFVDDDGGDGDHGDGNKEEEEGEDLYNDNYMEDYRRMDDQDRYETVGMDDSMEDERDLDQIMADRRAAEVELDARDGRTGDILDRKLPRMLYDQDMDDDINFRRPKRFRADFRPPAGGRSEDDTEGSTQSSPGRFQRGHSRDDVPVTDQTDDDQYEDEYDGEDDIMCHVQGTLREWVTRDEVRNEHGDIEYVRLINEMVLANKCSLEIDYKQFIYTEANIAIWLADAPQSVLEVMEEVAKNVVFDMHKNYKNIHQKIFVRITNLPVKYDCNKCGAILGPFFQNTYSEVKVGSCPECQSKGPFTINVEQTIYRNYQKLTLQESPGIVPAGRLPRYKEVILLNDLIDCARPGEEIEVTGIYTNNFDLSLNTKNGFPVFATVVEANYVTKKQDLFSAYKLTDEDKAEIEKLAKDPRIGERIIKSIAPSIYGHEDIKMAIALAMFGGQEKIVQGKHRLRGDINVLLLGDPGTAKSQFLKYVEKTGHRAVYTTGKGASAVGLTAAVHKDPVTREWTLEGGALVLADRGVCLIDEFDKMNDQDRVSIHEAMEQQSISISKAGIVTSLQARCSVIAAANPIGGRYDSSKTFTQNVELTDPIISRFDILCVVKDIVDPVTDEMLARFVVDSHAKSQPKGATLEDQPASNSQDELASSRPVDPEILSQDMLKKYITYAKLNVFPKLHDADLDKFKHVYADIRRESSHGQGIRIAVRHIESMIRMSEAHARMHLRNYVCQEDEDMAIRVLLDSFISSQKFGVQKALQKSYRKYMTFKKDFNELLLHLLRILVKDALHFEEIVSGTTARLTHIEVKVEELRNKAQEYEIYDLKPFFSSAHFTSSNFILDEGRGLYDKVAPLQNAPPRRTP
ncbi:DNA replication licensing factor [Musa troglodytarum]|uniref:DNA replication licensing factor MCM2 n=1 Tax=Musa troglodytarum TaxID=320322 RepID=A0A9E7HB79_9LILI|nr:DNA replication licensing factor [Musa troglodytarum]